jgi:metal-responsive CopG/Arc/MetJ family transcriptional regulator
MVKKYQNSIGISLPREFVQIIDKIVKEYPDFKNRTGVIRFAVRKYYDELFSKKN